MKHGDDNVLRNFDGGEIVWKSLIRVKKFNLFFEIIYAKNILEFYWYYIEVLKYFFLIILYFIIFLLLASTSHFILQSVFTLLNLKGRIFMTHVVRHIIITELIQYVMFLLSWSFKVNVLKEINHPTLVLVLHVAKLSFLIACLILT